MVTCTVRLSYITSLFDFLSLPLIYFHSAFSPFFLISLNLFILVYVMYSIISLSYPSSINNFTLLQNIQNVFEGQSVHFQRARNLFDRV
jgi:hypothetical protein